ncbi:MULTISPECIES: hypothetical protein [unclassified Kribbella]|uniref:hypothetical protein n=1 Tax=unclassified Kribbella TaxID=2644121 RepID=UPI0030197A7B
MTDDLSTKLAVLTDDRPEPADPAAPIRLRIKRRQRRRRGAAVVVATAAATAAVLAAGPVLNNIRSAGNEPGVAGFNPSIPMLTAAPTVLPPPWSDEVFTKLPVANSYKPKAYYVAKGTIPTESWAMLAFSEYGCMVSYEVPANSFGRPWVCFNEWKPGQRVDHRVIQGHLKEKDAPKIDQTLVFGAVSADARKVAIKAGGKSYTADAVGTPATDRLRFFALVIPRRDLQVTEVTPLDADNKLADAPTGVPTAIPCNPPDCAIATPVK